jgi:hypothetical protein
MYDGYWSHPDYRQCVVDYYRLWLHPICYDVTTWREHGFQLIEWLQNDTSIIIELVSVRLKTWLLEGWQLRTSDAFLTSRDLLNPIMNYIQLIVCKHINEKKRWTYICLHRCLNVLHYLIDEKGLPHNSLTYYSQGKKKKKEIFEYKHNNNNADLFISLSMLSERRT